MCSCSSYYLFLVMFPYVREYCFSCSGGNGPGAFVAESMFSCGLQKRTFSLKSREMEFEWVSYRNAGGITFRRMYEIVPSVTF